MKEIVAEEDPFPYVSSDSREVLVSLRETIVFNVNKLRINVAMSATHQVDFLLIYIIQFVFFAFILIME